MTEVVSDNALARLNELSARSLSIQGAIAYWCFPPSQLDPGFLRGVAHRDGFICCDLHSPTSINCLDEMSRGGANVYLLLYQLTGKTEVKDSKGIPDHLMHSKVLVFNTSPTECVIWVGSHNATARALHGINFECALLETTMKGSSLHVAVMSHLEEIRDLSTRFNSDDVDYYRALQGGLLTDGFIEIEDPTGAALRPDEEVTVFGTDPNDHKQLTRVGTKMYLAVSDSVGCESIYSINLVQTGRFTESNRHGTNFGPRRYAFKVKKEIPTLTSPKSVQRSVYDHAAFFAVVAVDKVLDGYVAVEAPPEQLWQNIDSGAYRTEVATSKPNRPPYKIQRAAREALADVSRGTQTEWSDAFRVLPLAARRTMQSSSLFRRRLLKFGGNPNLDAD